jgi:hypothetical protein
MLAFTVRVLPLYLAALALTVAGWAVRAPQAWLAPLAISLLLVFSALMTFRRSPTWSTTLLLAFALGAGVLVRLVSGAEVAWALCATAALGIPLVAAVMGGRLQGCGTWARSLLWVAAWIYVLGAWLIPVVWAAPHLGRAWAAAGLAVFAGLAVTWFSVWPGREAGLRAGSAAAEFYLIGLNLALAANALVSA